MKGNAHLLDERNCQCKRNQPAPRYRQGKRLLGNSSIIHGHACRTHTPVTFYGKDGLSHHYVHSLCHAEAQKSARTVGKGEQQQRLRSHTFFSLCQACQADHLV